MGLSELCLASAGPTAPAELWLSWSLAPETAAPLALGLAWLLREARRGRATWPAFAGWLALALALVSPLCRMAATTAAAHMAQHLLLAVAAPALLAAGLRKRTRAFGNLPGPISASALYAAAIWLAHAPRLYDAALLDARVHLLTLAGLLGASLPFWRTLLAAGRDRPGTAVLMALLALMQTGVLGALLTFAREPWYAAFGAGPALWGLTALEDQQLAGLLMWAPMALAYLAAGLWAVNGLLRPGAADRRRPA